jgi:hypothetical protein
MGVPIPKVDSFSYLGERRYLAHPFQYLCCLQYLCIRWLLLLELSLLIPCLKRLGFVEWMLEGY